jgi:nucleoside-diphosphate-sugar epimerase
VRTLVTGATGFIGGRLVERLIADGESVTILYRGKGPLPFASSLLVRTCMGDLLDAASIRRAMAECDRVYHLAAYARPWARDPATFARANVSGLRNLLHAARDAKVRRVVFTSTAMTIGSRGGSPADESCPSPAVTRTLYARSKIAAETEAIQANGAGLPIVIVNPTRVFGPGVLTEANSATRMIQLYLEGKWRWALGAGGATGNYAFIEDVVEGHILAMDRGRPGERYILGGENMRFSEFLDAVADVSDRRRRLFHIPPPLALLFAGLEAARGRWTAHRPLLSPEWVREFLSDWPYSTAKAETELGYRPTPLREAIARTIAWIEQGAAPTALQRACERADRGTREPARSIRIGGKGR